jgi:undecaprenyl-diphosphatase
MANEVRAVARGATPTHLHLRERVSMIALVTMGVDIAGSALVYLAVGLAKDGFERPRPGGALISAAGSSFPSGHAAYSTIWVAAAIALAWCIPGVARRTLLIAAALAVSVAVGLTRIYLRVHYWSDVAAGWGLGAGILGACAAAALTVVLIRQNAHGRASSDPASGAP